MIQAKDAVAVHFGHTDVPADIWKQYSDARKAMENACQALLYAAAETPEGLYMKKLGASFQMNRTTSWGKLIQAPHFTDTGVTITHRPLLTTADGSSGKPSYMAESTMNVLLTGKLLTDKEKRELLKAIIPEGVLDNGRVENVAAGKDNDIPF